MVFARMGGGVISAAASATACVLRSAACEGFACGARGSGSSVAAIECDGAQLGLMKRYSLIRRLHLLVKLLSQPTSTEHLLSLALNVIDSEVRNIKNASRLAKETACSIVGVA